jgi:hypothetical protein
MAVSALGEIFGPLVRRPAELARGCRPACDVALGADPNMPGPYSISVEASGPFVLLQADATRPNWTAHWSTCVLEYVPLALLPNFSLQSMAKIQSRALGSR